MGITVEDYMRAVAKGVRRGMSRVLVLEPQTGPWASQNLWGDQRVQALPPGPNAVIQVLPKNSSFYGPPAVHSVQLARGDETFASNADIRARVTYGCGGINNQFFCDWLHGVQFALVCNSISVDAVSYAPSLTIPYQAAGGSTFIGASVCKGTVTQGRCPASFTESQETIAVAKSYNISRDFTREVCVHLIGNNNPAVATGVFIEFINSGGFLVRYDAQVCAGGRAIPVPGGALALLLSSAAPFTPVVQWFLGL